MAKKQKKSNNSIRPVGWEDIDLRQVSWCGDFLTRTVKRYDLCAGEVVIFTNKRMSRIRLVKIGIGGVPAVECPLADTAGERAIMLRIARALATMCPKTLRADDFVTVLERMHKNRKRNA